MRQKINLFNRLKKKKKKVAAVATKKLQSLAFSKFVFLHIGGNANVFQRHIFDLSTLYKKKEKAERFS